jgi:GNAT superfamily N-acetyltransferase
MIHLRKATLEDLDTLLKFEQGIIQAERPMDPTLKREKTHYYDLPWMIESDEFEFIIAEVDGNPAGCGFGRILKARECFQHEKYCYLGFMFTLPEYRRKGVNKAVMNHLYDWSRQNDVYEVRLTVYPTNLPAIKSYEKSGMAINLHTMRVDLRKLDS